jgi:hypothetical protein
LALAFAAVGCGSTEELAELAQAIDAQPTGICSATNEVAVEGYRAIFHELGRIAPGRDYVNYYGRLALTADGEARCASRSGCPQFKAVIDMQDWSAATLQILANEFPWAPYLDTALLSAKMVGAMPIVSDPVVGTMGFEQAASWASSTATVASSADAQSGATALAVNAANYATMVSLPMSTVGTVGTTATLWIKLPSPQVNPWWYGAVQLYVSSPSTNHYNVYVGQAELTGRPLGSYQMLSFPLSSDLQSWLKGSYSDLRVSIALNVPAGNGTYLIDGLSFGAPVAAGSSGATTSPPPPSASPNPSLPYVAHELTFQYVATNSQPHCVTDRFHCFSVVGDATVPDSSQFPSLALQYLQAQIGNQPEVTTLADPHVDGNGMLCIDPETEVGTPGGCADGNMPQYRTAFNVGACCVKDGVSGTLVEHETLSHLLVCR